MIKTYFVPVMNMKNEPLMPTILSRAKKWIETGKATPFWKKGVFCVRLNVKTEENKQDIAVGIDPGSKKEGFTVKSHAHTFLNVQADAVVWVKDGVKERKFC
jgi:RRXRR protein